MKNLILIVTILALITPTQGQLLKKLKEKTNAAVSSSPTSVNTPASNSENNQTEIGSPAASSKKNKNDAIVFSKSSFQAGASPTLEKSFLSTDNIYAHLTLPDGIKSFFDPNDDMTNELRLTVELSNVVDNISKENFVTVIVPKEKYNDKFLDFDILPSQDDINTVYLLSGSTDQIHLSILFKNFGDLSTEIPFGKRAFTVKIGNRKTDPTGTFELSVADVKEKKALVERIKNISRGASAALAKTATLPEIFGKPSGKFKDPELNLQNLKRLLATTGGITPLKMVIAEGEYEYLIEKNDLGIPLSKTTAKPVWVAFKGTNDKCYYSRFWFTRTYEGGGKYGSLKVARTPDEAVEITCEKIK